MDDWGLLSLWSYCKTVPYCKSHKRWDFKKNKQYLHLCYIIQNACSHFFFNIGVMNNCSAQLASLLHFVLMKTWTSLRKPQGLPQIPCLGLQELHWELHFFFFQTLDFSVTVPVRHQLYLTQVSVMVTRDEICDTQNRTVTQVECLECIINMVHLSFFTYWDIYDSLIDWFGCKLPCKSLKRSDQPQRTQCWIRAP